MIASKMADRLGIPHIPYTLLWDDGIPYSVCEDFVTPDTELIPAWRVMQIRRRTTRLPFINTTATAAKNWVSQVLPTPSTK